jgi:hypothetical protein
MGNRGRAAALPVPSHGRSHSLSLTLPPLAAVFFKPGDESTVAAAAARAEESEPVPGAPSSGQ